eukprot:m.171018 g.171018  ORF g.171018 m.171018 type:complete len:65 (+) comp14805_c0_seq5:43-237(+)
MGCCDSKEEEAASTERSPLLNTSPASPGKRMTVVLEEPTPSKILIGSQDNKYAHFDLPCSARPW